MTFNHVYVLSVEAGMMSYIGPGPSHGPTMRHGAKLGSRHPWDREVSNQGPVGLMTRVEAVPYELGVVAPYRTKHS